jgi:hypothetical protein
VHDEVSPGAAAAEEKLIADMERVLRRKMERDYPPGATKRDAHPKHTGLLEATFAIDNDLPPELRVGLFAEPRSYRAWVRLSNASGTPRSDAIPDFRGFAIKVVGVGGDKIPESDESDAQDFLLLSSPTVPFGDAKTFRDAIVLSLKFHPLVFAARLVLGGKAHILRAVQAARICPRSPLRIRYWSTTPYALGADRAVKYSVTPQSGVVTAPPQDLSDNYLSEVMAAHLAERPAVFDFAVQVRANGMPLDDAAVAWDEAVAPFRKVATLTVPPQTFRTEERAALAEKLRFSPAHARVEHRPLGSINRARMRIYRLLSEFRQRRNGRT